MRKKPNHCIGKKGAKGREPIVITTSLVVLGVLVFICAGMLIAPLWTAAVEVWQFHPNSQECRSLKGVAARQTCLEQLSARAL
jgi:hypothetical protein